MLNPSTSSTKQGIAKKLIMADTPPVSSSGASSPPSSAADQARIRKERREAKLRAGGSARLQKITGLGSGAQREVQTPAKASAHPDPDEVDISQHFYEPTSNRTRARPNSSPSAQQQMNDDQIRQMMLGYDPSSTSSTPPPGTNPFAGFPGLESMANMAGNTGMADMNALNGMGGPDGANDPMMKMLQQMMGSVPGEGLGGMPSFPEMPGMPGQAAAAAPYAYLWRIVHAIFALGLGLYIAFTTTFNGTRIERERSCLTYKSSSGQELSSSSIQFFWIFATAEVLLQTSRFYMEKSRVQQGGVMGMVMGFLPEPWKGYLTLATRYGRIWTTVSGDAMVCVFVLGICSWLREA